MKITSILQKAFARALGRKPTPEPLPPSLVLLMSEPYAQTTKLYEAAAGHAFGVPYDGSDPLYCVVQAPDFFFLKAGPYLVTIQPHHGAYLAEKSEYDTAHGATFLHENQTAWWHQQRAWVSFDLQNTEVADGHAIKILAKLLLPLLDSRCCGVWIPSRKQFLPHDGRALIELQRLSGSSVSA